MYVYAYIYIHIYISYVYIIYTYHIIHILAYHRTTTSLFHLEFFSPKTPPSWSESSDLPSPAEAAEAASTEWRRPSGRSTTWSPKGFITWWSFGLIKKFYGFKWIYIDSYRFYGFIGLYRALYGYIWIHMDLYGFMGHMNILHGGHKPTDKWGGPSL